MAVDADASSMDAWPTGRLLSPAARIAEHAWRRSLTEQGLTHGGLVVLHLLQDGPSTHADLASGARVTTQTIWRTIERLERLGYATTDTDSADRRRRFVSITTQGQRAWQAAHQIETEFFPEVEDDEGFRSTLLSIIRRQIN